MCVAGAGVTAAGAGEAALQSAQQSAQQELDAMARMFTTFLGQSSTHEGAELPGYAPAGTPFHPCPHSTAHHDGDDDDDIDFDMQHFVEALQGRSAPVGRLRNAPR